MPFASIEFRFSIHPKMHAQLTKTPNIRSLFPMYALKHAYPLEWHLRGSWNMAPAVASHSRTGNRAYPNRKATDSPGHDRFPDTRWRNGFEWHPALAWLPDSELGCIYPSVGQRHPKPSEYFTTPQRGVGPIGWMKSAETRHGHRCRDGCLRSVSAAHRPGTHAGQGLAATRIRRTERERII